MPHIEPPNAPAPIVAAAGLGIGIGGMLHGVVLNQLLDWHRTVSTWYPLTSGENIRINAVWDGVYHIIAYEVLSAGPFFVWRSSIDTTAGRCSASRAAY